MLPATVNFFKKLWSTNSTKEKEELIKECFTRTEVRKLLELALDPYTTSYIADPSALAKVVPMSSLELGDINISQTVTGFTYLMTRLSSRTYVGDEAKRVVAGFLQNESNETAREIYKAIIFGMPIGVTAKTINKIFPRQIPTFDLMLADNAEIDRDKIDYKSCLFTEKLDGFRCVYVNQKMLSRTGRVLPNRNLPLAFPIVSLYARGGQDLVFDGELWSPHMSLQEIASVVSSQDKAIPGHLKFYIFDTMSYIEWHWKSCKKTYQQRLALLDKVFPVDTNSPFVKIPTITFSNRFEMEKRLGEITTKGGEGLIGRKQDSLYRWKRVRNSTQEMFKIKPFQTIDLPIVDFYAGEGNFTGMMGGVVVKYKGNEVRVGSGWTHEQRQHMWKYKKQYLGKIVEVKYLHETTNKDGEKSLNLPTVIRLRTDKDV